MPYGTYEVSYNGAAFTGVGTITGSTFTYPVLLANPVLINSVLQMLKAAK
ncbi:hypothetical protein [Flavobacterium davisii]|uniref:Uncharacterized protein n=1 Tax=Flavobacterium columnare TaxID=996 RepID=A0A8G0KPZ5_9FLAO|nr:hypothetical protein [Flavobacterium davisii]QYS87938.1 hypothetical protein JJC05_08455 [Flavobacterium davisii]